MKHVRCQRVFAHRHWAVLPVITSSITQERARAADRQRRLNECHIRSRLAARRLGGRSAARTGTLPLLFLKMVAAWNEYQHPVFCVRYHQ